MKKELIKPKFQELEYANSDIDLHSENRCGGDWTCNKVCDGRGGSRNNSLRDDEIEIIF